jgi:hypothetical protein
MGQTRDANELFEIAGHELRACFIAASGFAVAR